MPRERDRAPATGANQAEAEVWIDGELAGLAPLELERLSFGEHDVRVTKDGFLPLEESFELVERKPLEPLVFALQPERTSSFLESVLTASRCACAKPFD